jgi:hypothetical protein
MYAQSKGLFDVVILAAAVESIILTDTGAAVSSGIGSHPNSP